MNLAFYFYITAEIPILMPVIVETAKRGVLYSIIIHAGFDDPYYQKVLEVEIKNQIMQNNLKCPIYYCRRNNKENWIDSFYREVPGNTFDFIITSEPRRTDVIVSRGQVAIIYHGIGWTKGQSIKQELEWERQASISFVTGELQKKVIRKYQPNKCVCVVGYPKFDIAWRYPLLKGVRWKQFHKYPNFLILYAPTWDNTGSLNYIGEQIVELPYRKIITLHRNTIEKRHDKKDWVGFYKIHDIEINENPNIIKYIRNAHVVITDHSSIALEALALNRPVIAFENGAITEQKEKLWWQMKDLMYIVHSFKEIEELLKKGVGLKQGHKERVRDICKYPTGASKRILDYLQKYENS